MRLFDRLVAIGWREALRGGRRGDLDALFVLSLSGCASLNVATLLVFSSQEYGLLGPVTSGLTILLSIAAARTAAWHKRSADHWREEASTYGRMLNDYFFVSKVDAEGRFCDANKNLLQRTGYTLEELAATPLGGLNAGFLSDEYLSNMWSTVKSGRTWSGEFCDSAKSGEAIWFRVVIVPKTDSRGELVSLTTIGVDVTEQRSTEMQLKEAHARLEAFIKHAPAAVAMFDTEMRYVAHTDRWLQDYSLPQTSLVGVNHYDVFPETPPHWKAKHQRIMGGATEICEEERFLRADGSENIIRWEVRPWYLQGNNIGGIMMLTEEISERKKLRDQLWSLAKLDSLTGLPNRLLFNETLRGAIDTATESGCSLGVALLDLDHFKEINDTLGHDAGDEVLKIVAQRLEEAIGGSGTIARLGGDEFALLLLGFGGDDVIYAITDQIKEALSEPMDLGGALRSCSASIGLTLFPRDATDPSDLLKNADLALYRAKASGRGRTDIFSPDLRASIDRRVELQGAALEALQRDEFTLYFQPIISTAGDPPSFEALLRWKHPKYGVLAPPLFEEILEDSSVAIAIGDRVMDLAIQQASVWLKAGVAFGRIAINVTGTDFAMGSLSERLQAKLNRAEVGPDKICIEVTERVFLGGGAAHVGDALVELDALGVEIALDDFGTGYASLSHIKAYPIGRLKVDRSFVRDMQENTDNLSIVEAIVQLGRSLGLATTAEGVETDAQLALLRSMGCGSLQGYYFSKPVPAEELWQFLGKQRCGAQVA